jgi:hypothetical protein
MRWISLAQFGHDQLLGVTIADYKLGVMGVIRWSDESRGVQLCGKLLALIPDLAVIDTFSSPYPKQVPSLLRVFQNQGKKVSL